MGIHPTVIIIHSNFKYSYNTVLYTIRIHLKGPVSKGRFIICRMPRAACRMPCSACCIPQAARDRFHTLTLYYSYVGALLYSHRMMEVINYSSWGLFQDRNTDIISLVSQKFCSRTYQMVGPLVIVCNFNCKNDGWVYRALRILSSKPVFKSQTNFGNFFIFNYFLF